MERTDETPLSKLERVLVEQGVVAGLHVLNGRAPHRFTGIYRFAPDVLKNVNLVDAFTPEMVRGEDVPLRDAYCVLLEDRRQISFDEPSGAPGEFKGTSPVVSYCGVLLVGSNGEPFGSLCHFDTKRCQRPDSEMRFLETAAPIFMAAIEARTAS